MILRPVRTSQPQGLARIDWSNPITRGLVAATIGGNVAQGNAVSHQSPRLFREGTAFDCTGSEFIDFGSVFNNTNPASLVALFNPDSTAPAIGQEADIISCGDRLTLRVNSTGPITGQITFYLFDGNTWYGVSSGVQVVPGNTCFAAGVYSGNKNAVFLKQIGVFSTASASSTQRAATTQPLRVGLSAETGRSLNGGVLFTAAFNRALSDAEIKSLSDNPWQIFAPDSKSLWVPETVSAGGGATTGTLAATESGSDTAVISGQVVVQGGITATESGSDTADLSAKVIVTGALSATETGQDTADLAGQVIITGTLAAAEIGSDTAVINGSASVTTTGTLAATESGTDTAALTGRLLVQGALSATESGSDAAAIAGQVLVQGTIAATEQGSDTALINGSSVIITTGTLNATEQGSDTAAMTGQVLVQALIDAAEQGADTAQLVGQIVVTGVLAAAEVGGDTAAFFQSEAVFLPSIHNAYVPLPRNQAYAPLAANQAYVPTPTNQAYLP